jgi:hypothetical protein
MITFIAVMVVMNFILLCLNEYGAIHNAKAQSMQLSNIYQAINATEERVIDLEKKVEEFQST